LGLPNPWATTTHLSFSWDVTYECEVCVNSVPSSFPPFYVTLQGTATGYESDGSSAYGVGSASAQLQNSPAYFFPCP
jgi:hypothetical protein